MHLFGSHFGTYEVAQDEDGAPQLRPFRLDPAPNEIGMAYLDLARHPRRILRPMVRRGWLEARTDLARRGCGRGRDSFVPVSWDEAETLAGEELTRIRERHGNRAIFGGSYGWASAGRFHHAQSQLKRFLNLAGGFTGAVNTYSYGTAAVLLPHVIGKEYRDAGVFAPSWDQIAAHTGHLIAFGGLRMSNAGVEAGGTGSHRVGDWLRRAQARGLTISVISPTKADMPAGGGVRHIPIRPGTDTSVLLAMAHVLLARGRADEDFIARCTVGFGAFSAYLRGEEDGIAKTPAWAEAISGVPAATIEELAASLGGGTLVNLAWSLQRARFGEQPFWAAIALCAMAGTIGSPGAGVAFGLTAVNSVGQPVRRLQGPALPQGRNPISFQIPVAAISELLSRPGGHLDYDGARLELPDIRLVWWAGGNPFHHHQDLNRLADAFRRPETVIVHESVWTATALHADIVLPAALPFERNDLAASSRDNWMVASRLVREPPEHVRTDHAILAGIAGKLGLHEAFTESRDEMAWIAHLYEGYRSHHPELPGFAAFWEQGYAQLDPRDDAPRPLVPLADFVADPQRHPLSTPSGRIELASARIAGFGYDDCPGHPAWLEPEEWLGGPLAQTYPFQMLSPQPARRLHSQLDGAGPSQRGKVAGHEPMQMNAADARRLGISAGEVVEIHNGRGSCLVAALPSDDVAPGVIVLETGAWYDPRPFGGRIVDHGGSPNSLTADRRSSRLSQGCAPNSPLVAIRKLVRPEATAQL